MRYEINGDVSKDIIRVHPENVNFFSTHGHTKFFGWTEHIFRTAARKEKRMYFSNVQRVAHTFLILEFVRACVRAWRTSIGIDCWM